MLHGLDHRKVSFCFGSSPILCMVLRQGPQVGKLCSPFAEQCILQIVSELFLSKEWNVFWVPCNIKTRVGKSSSSCNQKIRSKENNLPVNSFIHNQTVVWYLCDPKKFRWLWSWHESLSNCDNYLLLLIIIIIWETHLFMTTNNILRDN